MLWTFVCDLIGLASSAMSRILVVEKTSNIQTLLGDRSSQDHVCVDAMPWLEQLCRAESTLQIPEPLLAM